VQVRVVLPIAPVRMEDGEVTALKRGAFDGAIEGVQPDFDSYTYI